MRYQGTYVDCVKNGIVFKDNMVIYELNHLYGQASCEYAAYSLLMRGAFGKDKGNRIETRYDKTENLLLSDPSNENTVKRSQFNSETIAPRPEGDKYYPQFLTSDPVYAVWFRTLV